MVGGAIPAYRLPQASIDQDLAALERLGVEIRYGQRARRRRQRGRAARRRLRAVLVAVGAQRGKRLGLPGEDAAGVLDGVDFLRGVREGRAASIGPRVAVIGAGDTAMDCARSARRVGAISVQVIYRRTIDQMPADREEVHELHEEGIEVLELARPVGLLVSDGRLVGLRCVRTAYGAERDAAGRKVPHDVPGSEFEVALETLILAVSQEPVLDLFAGLAPALTADGYLATDPTTLATSIEGVYAAGDVAAHGPASIVRAAADGKRAAAAIAAALGLAASVPPGTDAYRPEPRPDVQALTVRRAHRQYRTPVRTTGSAERHGFDETVLGYTVDEATLEASRCLDCDQLCSLCVGVCPNLAIVTYESEPRHWQLPTLDVRAGRVSVDAAPPEPFGVEQRFQVAVLTDLCNECGTCVTACPTSGRPYVDKPRLYLDGEDFDAETANAFRLLDARTHRGPVRGARRTGSGWTTRQDGRRLAYEAPGLRLTLERDSLAVVDASIDGTCARWAPFARARSRHAGDCSTG